MLHRSRPAWLAAGGALLLILSMSGIAAAATIVSDTTSGTQDTTLPAGDNAPSVTFVDLNGNGIDDTCETAVTPDGIAATAASTAADLDGDGAISVSEAAQSGWVGGTECNHGGYVSSVAKTSTDGCDQAGDSGDTTESADASSGDAADGAAEDSGDQATDPSTITTSTTTTTCAPTSTDTAPTVCPVVAPIAPTDGAAPVVDPAPNAHGVAVSTVAQSDAVGGKNCDHGGAVSEAAKAAHGAKPDQAAKHAAHLAKHHGQGHGGQD